MQYIGFIFGIFGLLAYLEVSSLKNRVSELERELTKTKGTSFHDERVSLLEAAKSYIGEKVELTLKEDHTDVDVVMYGNTKYGSVTIVDADEEWMRVYVETPKGNKEKLLRMESVAKITKL